MEKYLFQEINILEKHIKKKLKKIREILKEKGADYNIISSLDDIAWIYNFRGDDVQHNPVALSLQ